MSEQSQLGPSYDGSVMIDIGGDRGALMIYTGPDLHLAEIEISRTDGGPVPGHSHGPGHDHDHDHEHADGHGHAAPRTHVAVRERRGPSGTRFAAIYPTLPAGDYTVWGIDGGTATTVTIHGGQITELDWR